MTTSGTTIFDLDIVFLIEEAFEQAGIESRSGYDMRTARRSLDMMFMDWANRGLNMWTIEERTQALTSGDGVYTLGSDIVDLVEHVIRVPNTTDITDYQLARVSITTYATQTAKELPGRPTQIYIDRQQPAPIVHLWPIPNESGYSLIYWILRRIDDAGAFTNTTDVPFRFVPALARGLAYEIARKKAPDNTNLIARLKAEYEETFQRAADEDREKAPLKIVPRGDTYRVGRY